MAHPTPLLGTAREVANPPDATQRSFEGVQQVRLMALPRGVHEQERLDARQPLELVVRPDADVAQP